MTFIAGDTPSLGTLFDLAFERWERQAQFAFPAKVVSYDATAHTVELQPQHHEVWRDGDNRRSERLPNLPDVPVLYQRAGGFALYIPPAPGDFMLCVCTKYSLDRWRETARAGDPGDMRRFSLDGCVAIPGLFPDPQVADCVGNSDTATFVIPSGKQLHLGTYDLAASFIALADKIDSAFNAMVAVELAVPPAPQTGAVLQAALQAVWGAAGAGSPDSCASTKVRSE